MGWNVSFWIEAIIAIFFGLLMLINSFRYKERMFRLMFFLFFILMVKSFVYISLRLTDVSWTLVQTTSGVKKVLEESMVPLYNLKYIIFQALEFIYLMMFYYIIMSNRKKAEEKSSRGTFIFTGLLILISILFTSAVIYLSVQYGDRENFKTNFEALELIKSTFGTWIFTIAKLIVIIIIWRTVNLVSGYIASQVKIINIYRRLIYIYLTIEFIFNLFSPINYYAQPGWFALQIIAILLICVFAFGVHTGFIKSVQDRVESLIKEKDSLIVLMKEISLVVGGGEFEIETVIRAIVDNSVKGTIARGGVMFLKDKITNRLVVKYIKGLYPPTKPLKNIQNLTLTENIIIEKLRAEKLAIGEGLIGQVAENGKSIYIPDVSKDERFVQTVSDHLMVSSFLAVPLKTRDDVFGVLSVVDDSKMFLENDLSLLETLGEQAAITITQVQMYQEVLEKKQAEKELGVAGEIQASLIPHSFPQSDKFDIFGFSIPAKGVGGDYYDYIDFGNNKVVLTMFDVSGKGVPAALIMVMIRSILRTVATLNEDTKDVIARLNNTIAAEIVEDRYATGFYLLFDAEKGIMSYTNAGHGPLILYRSASDDFEFLDTEGMPIGIMSGVEYGQNYTILEKGDIAILYTDGISEAMNLAHEEFGLERFKEVIRNYKKEGAKEICNRVLEAVTSFGGTAPQHDDETLLVLKSK